MLPFQYFALSSICKEIIMSLRAPDTDLGFSLLTIYLFTQWNPTNGTQGHCLLI